MDRSTIPFKRVLDNITSCAQRRELVIQTLFMKVHDQPPANAEIEAYIKRIADILRAGGKIKLIQIYTVARHTTEAYATALSPTELVSIGKQIETALPDIAVHVFP